MRNNYRRSSVLLLDQNIAAVEELQGTREEQRRTKEEQRNPKCGSMVERCRDLPALRSHGGRRRFSGPVQGDAAAKVEEDKGRGGGGGARALGRQRRKTMEERGE